MAVIELVLEPVNPKPKTKKASTAEEANATSPVVDGNAEAGAETIESVEVALEQTPVDETVADETVAQEAAPEEVPANGAVQDFVSEGAPATPAVDDTVADSGEDASVEETTEEVAEEETK
jgi:large subunit ribosomal protein L17